MPDYGADFTNRIAMVSGWGRLKYFGQYPTVLQEVDVRTRRFYLPLRNFFNN